jgi:hypothetical protein
MSRRSLVVLVAAAAMLTAVPAGAEEPALPGPASSGVMPLECGSIPSDRDIAVTRKVYEVGQRRNVSPRAMLAGFETGWVESHMNNLACGDRDSLGVFQQRPSQGWGTPEQVLNVDYAANKFFEVAQQMEPNVGGSAGTLAQAVQRSAFPDRYDQAEGIAVQMRDEAFQPYGTIGDKYAAMGGANSVLGLPVRAEADARLGGRFTQFERGMIIWHPDVAFAVYGDILSKYWATDSEAAWGFPIMDEADAGTSPNGTTGRFQKFEGALFLWSAPTGTHIVHGAIGDAFAQNGNERSLGYPTSEEISSGDGGVFQNFQNAVIHWHPDRGTWITR